MAGVSQVPVLRDVNGLYRELEPILRKWFDYPEDVCSLELELNWFRDKYAMLRASIPPRVSVEDGKVILTPVGVGEDGEIRPLSEL